MGLFKKTPKVSPKITVDGIEISFDPQSQFWGFTYREHEFVTCGSHLHMPSRERLDGILSDVAVLSTEMCDRLANGWKDWGDVKMNDGESYEINLESFGSEVSFCVTWSGGATWGDMWIDFNVKDRKIVDESWND